MLPGPYERWFVELAGRPAPVESRSTCDACAMLPGAPGLPPEGPFDPAVRCCTYHPQLAPHFVGAILRGGGAHGQRVVRARLAARAGVTPLGLMPSPSYAAAHQRLSAQPGSFGRSLELQCPFNRDSRCTIWEQRGIVCAAFHCKYDRGALGAGLWNLLVIAFNAIERALARRLLERHGLDPAACDALLHAPEDEALDRRAWGRFHGREADYFLEAARFAEGLSWGEVVALAGGSLEGLAEALRGALERFERLVAPAQVRRNRDALVQLGERSARICSPGAPLDPLEVPREVGERLARFEQGPLAQLRDELGAQLDESLVRQLIDWQVLL